MCFSAGASFCASAVLLGAGVATLRHVKSPGELPFAAIPVFFSIQQLSEGFLWLSLSHGDYALWEAPATYVFFIFAQIFWPVWVPYALWKLEEDSMREHILRFFVVAGILLAAYLVYSMAAFGVEAAIQSNHIRYGPRYPYGIPRTILYLLIVGTPLFLSSRRRMTYFGVAIVAGLAVSLLFYRGFLVSVWCLFAAVASVLVLWILREPEEVRATAPG